MRGSCIKICIVQGRGRNRTGGGGSRRGIFEQRGPRGAGPSGWCRHPDALSPVVWAKVAFRDDVRGISARLVRAVTNSTLETPALTSGQGDALRDRRMECCFHANALIRKEPIYERDYLPAAHRLDVSQIMGGKNVLVLGEDVSLDFMGSSPQEIAKWALASWLMYIL